MPTAPANGRVGGSSSGCPRMWRFGWWQPISSRITPPWLGSGAQIKKRSGGLFSQVLGLCAREGLIRSGVVGIDGTKMEANASAWSNRTRRQIVDEILAEA